MQATLLGVSIAIILALVAALVGPHFVDWAQYRSVFEVEATRVTGLPVRIAGAIDARILPTPSVVLRDIEIGGAGDAARLRAQRLSIELGLGPLLRGERRATEMRLVGPELKLGLNAAGQIDWPSAPGFDPDRMAIEQLAIEEGRITLSHAESDARLELDKFWFTGEVRSLAGPIKGEGGFASQGERYGFRFSSGRPTDDGSARIRFAVDPADRPLAIELDGVVRRDGGTPRLDGTLTLARPAGIARGAGKGIVNVPWRATGKVKASPAGALIEQIELQYGPDDRAIKLTGTAEAKFGRKPRLEGLLSATQVDLDRLVDLPEPERRLPVPVLRTFAETFGSAVKPPIPARLGMSIDNLTVAGTSIQAVRGDVKIDGTDWDLETLEFRAPGSTQARASGRVSFPAAGATFKGPVSIEATDPRALFGWIEGRTDTRKAQVGPLRVTGELLLASNRVAIERLNANIDRKAVEGRFAYAFGADARSSRLEAELKAGEIDLDEMIAVSQAAFAGTKFEWPGEAVLAIELGQATIAGTEAKQASAQLRFDPQGLLIERLAIADLGGAKIDLRGRLEALTVAPRGNVTLDIDARALDGTLALLSRVAPQTGAALSSVAGLLAPLKLRAAVNVTSPPKPAQSTAKISLEGNAGVARLRLALEGNGDVGSIENADIRLTGQIAAEDGRVLAQLTGVDRVIEVDKRPGMIELAARGRLGGDLRLDARLSAAGLAAAANGTIRMWGDEPLAATLDLSVSAADAAPLRRIATAPASKLPLVLRTRLALARGELTLADLSGTVAGAPVRGLLRFALGRPLRVEGKLEAESLDAPGLVALAIGLPPQAPQGGSGWSSEPFAPNLLDGVSGRVDFTATRVALTPTAVGRQARGAFRIGEGELAIEDVEATVGGGRVQVQLGVRRSSAGVAASGRLALTNVDATAVIPADARPPVSGRLSLQVEMEGSGLSPAALIGSLKGNGSVVLDGGQLAGLDPKAFDTVIRAIDRGATLDAGKVKEQVGAALESGSLAIRRADASFAIAAGQARLGTKVLKGQGADLSISGMVDLPENAVDLRLVLSGPQGQDATGAGRPDIFVALKGPLSGVKRTIDVSALTGWLTLRSVERETKRIESMEGRDPPATTATPGPPAAPPPAAPPPAAPPPAAPPPAAVQPAAPPPAAAPVPAPAPAARVPAAPHALPRPHEPDPPRAANPPSPPRPEASIELPERPQPPVTPAPPPAAKQAPKAPPRARPPAPQSRSILDSLFGTER